MYFDAITELNVHVNEEKKEKKAVYKNAKQKRWRFILPYYNITPGTIMIFTLY